MLAHSPPLLLVIDYLDDHDITPEDEEGILLALQQRDRVRRIRLEIPALTLQRFLVLMDKEFPMLEYLFIAPTSTFDSDMRLVLPETFQALHLRHLILADFTFSIKSPLLSNTMGLVTLSLVGLHSPGYFHPNDLFQRLSMMPYLETLMIDFHSPVPHRDIKWQLRSRPITTDIITLPSIRWLSFWGTSDYLEAILPSIVTPFLEKLDISFFNQLTFSIPHLQQFLTTMEAHRFNSATLVFEKEVVYMIVYPRRFGRETLSIQVRCSHYDWQVASMVQITDALVAVSSVVEHLALNYKKDSIPSEWQNESDRTLWHCLLRPFGNVKTLHVAKGLVKELSRTLQPEDGEPLMELLPELKVLEYPAADEADDAFSTFSAVRENIGHPFSLNPSMNTPRSATQPYAVVPGIQKNSSECVGLTSLIR
jgi:hypothetical protein